ncbi:MAG: PAC2 family protein [Candidatus Poseidoniaceae archaeon]|jgi:predicted ATP-grasp superfamily ATP-dependent carboligase|nr:PAC2 family protein [Candidatus Poseidoniaceae archaeon]MDP7000900.1 PAC2 family protein [Candidatus Poseidoniaceae archaeon]
MVGEHASALVIHGDSPATTGGIAICGFSSVGMVGAIGAAHIIRALDLPQVGTVLNPDFPAVALVHEEIPKHPVRVYQGDGIGVFTSELKFPPQQDVEFANTVLDWFTHGGFDHLYIIDGIERQDVEQHERSIHGIGSTSLARQALRSHDIEPISQGVIAGIPGYLLSEGDRRGLNVTALLAECSSSFPDARAAALAVEAFGEMAQFEIPLTKLLEDARKIEESVQHVFESQQSMLPAPDGYVIPKDDDDESGMFG